MPQTVVQHEREHLYAAPPSTEEGRRLSSALLALRHAEDAQADRSVRSTGLARVDFVTLRYLVQAQRDQRKISPKDVIVMLNTSSATVTNVIERLVTRGYLVRESHPTDRRAHYLVPTDAAVELVEAAHHDHHAAIVTAIDALDTEDIETATKVIELIVRQINDVGNSATR